MGKTHVLHVVGEMNYGGTEAFLMNLLRSVDRGKYQFDFVEQTPKSCAHDEEILALGSRIFRCPHISLTSLGVYRKWWRDFFAQHPEYQIIHGHSRGSAPIYMDEAHRANRIVIAHCHSNSHGRGFKGAVRYIWQLPLRRLGDYNFACSHDSGISQYGKNASFTVIKNGIQADRFSWNPEERELVRRTFGIRDEEIVIGNVARFESPKNHVYLIKIFYEIFKLDSRARLMLIGTGTQESYVRQTIRQYGLDDRVLFLGNRDDVYRYYQAMDAFVLPSLFEGLGIVNLEAQASGLQCFASSKVVAPESKVSELMHFISLEESPRIWADTILNCLSNQSSRTSHVQDVRDAGFDIEDTARFLCDFYKKALGKHGKA